MWFILLGIFLHQAARQSWEVARIQHRLEGVRVADVMTPSPITMPAQLALDRALDDFFRAHRVSAFPVQEDGRLVGLLTWSQVERAAAGAGAATLVRDVMLPVAPEMVVSSNDSAWSAFMKLSRNRAGRVAVVDGGRLVGIVSHRDLQRVLAVETVRTTITRKAA
jgi:CBS domain-containing protein